MKYVNNNTCITTIYTYDRSNIFSPDNMVYNQIYVII